MSTDCNCPEHRGWYECEYPGYHVLCDTWVEVWYSRGDGDECSEHGHPQGWYWWNCQPGCLPNGEPSGPFPTAKEAYEDAREILEDNND